MLVCALVATIIGFIHRTKFRELRFMCIYSIASIAQLLSMYYDLLNNSDIIHLELITGNLFIIVEFIILFNFFDNAIILKNLKRILKILFFIFFIYVAVLWSLTNSFYKYPIRLYIPQSFCILSFCFIYFFQLFKLPPKSNLLTTPAFWITIGCFFYFSCTIPLFFVRMLIELADYNNLYSINYLAYSILFLLITKSFLCHPVQTK